MNQTAPSAFTSKGAGETERFSVNFARICTAPISPVWTIAWESGTPHAAGDVSAMRVGVADIRGTRSTQLITGGTPGATYLVRVDVDQGDEHFYVFVRLSVTP